MTQENNSETRVDIDSTVEPAPLPVESKNNFKKTLRWIIVLLIFAPFVYFASMIVIFFTQSSIKMNRLNNNAEILQNELNSFVFVKGKQINAEGIVDGDGLTAKENPDESTFARGSLEINNIPLAQLENEIYGNLSKAGFERESSQSMPYYFATSYKGDNFDFLTMRYVKADKAIRITYVLDKKYSCPEDYICKNDPKSRAGEKIYPISGLGSLIVKRINIVYSSRSSNYHSGFLY